MSGISYDHKLQQVDDTTTSFFVVKALEGARRTKGSKMDARAPISLTTLHKMIGSLESICQNTFEQSLFRAAFTLAFFGLLRIGEFTKANNKSQDLKVIKYSDIRLSEKELNLTVRWSKTDQRGKSVTLYIPANGKSYCQVLCMKENYNLRPKSENANLFIHLNGKSLTRYQFKAIMSKALQFTQTIGHFKSHSFRIGGATHLASLETEESRIMAAGRWKSNAYTKYIRL